MKGPTGCRYLADERQKNYVRHGWNFTGDAYVMDADGYFFYQARTDDMIISRRLQHRGPGGRGRAARRIRPWPNAAWSACRDEERGQIVKAFVVLKPGFARDDAMVKSTAGAREAIASRPTSIRAQIEFVDALPRTETGKLQRFKLRAIGP